MNVKHASNILKKKYIDLLCIEITQTNKLILNLLTLIKNNKVKTAILAVIPDDNTLKETLLSYGCDDYICKPYSCEDLILRCKKLIHYLPAKYEITYESNFLKYEDKFNRIMYEDTYIPFTQREILIVKLLIKSSFVSKEDIRKYLHTRLGESYTDGYIRVLIHRVRTKIKLSTGRDLIRNRYGCSYYIL